MQIDNARIIVTGAASGIGFALMKQLAAHPCQIIAADLHQSALDEAIHALGNHPTAAIKPFAGDIGLPLTIDRLIEFGYQQMGGVDIFIANAGFAYYEAFGTPEWAHIEKIYAVNTIAPLYTLGLMAGLHRDGREFMVVITASTMAKIGIAGYALYASTKAALDRFQEAYQLEASPNAHLCIAYPISTRTGFFKGSKEKKQAKNAPVPAPTQTPEYVAAKIIKGIERNARTVNTSATFSLAYAIHRVIPILNVYKNYTRRQFEEWRGE
jgi:short-subunit dehydrogenase